MDNAKEIADMIITSCLKACIAAQVTTSIHAFPGPTPGAEKIELPDGTIVIPHDIQEMLKGGTNGQ